MSSNSTNLDQIRNEKQTHYPVIERDDVCLIFQHIIHFFVLHFTLLVLVCSTIFNSGLWQKANFANPDKNEENDTKTRNCKGYIMCQTKQAINYNANKTGYQL